jgi:hypothetical protein
MLAIAGMILSTKALISSSLLPETATSFAITTCATESLLLLACSSSSFMVAYGYFGCAFLRRLVPLPLDEAAADRVVLQLVEHGCRRAMSLQVMVFGCGKFALGAS